MRNIYGLTNEEIAEAQFTQQNFMLLKNSLNEDESNSNEINSKITTLLSLKEDNKLETLISYLQGENTKIAKSLYKERSRENELSTLFNNNEELIQKAMFEKNLRSVPKVVRRKRKAFI